MKCLDVKYYADVNTRAGKFHSNIMSVKIQTHAVFILDLFIWVTGTSHASGIGYMVEYPTPRHGTCDTHTFPLLDMGPGIPHPQDMEPGTPTNLHMGPGISNLPPLDMGPGIPTPTSCYWHDIWWSSLETCSNLFTWEHPHQYWHLVAATKTCTVARRAIGILLECFMFLIQIQNVPSSYFSHLNMQSVVISSLTRVWMCEFKERTTEFSLHWSRKWYMTEIQISWDDYASSVSVSNSPVD